MDSVRDLLRRHYLQGYDELKTRLTQRLGSADLAGDALQDAWLRLENATALGPVDRPHSYLLQVAYHLGLRSSRRRQETLTLDDARAALELTDDLPDAARVMEAREELQMLKLAMKDLSPRRRDILLASRLDGVPLRQLAVRHSISQRMVERELKAALTYCAERLGRKMIQRFGPQPRRVSDNGKDESSC